MLQEALRVSDKIIERLTGLGGKSDFCVPVSGAIVALRKDTLQLSGIDIGQVSAFVTRELIAEGKNAQALQYNNDRRDLIEVIDRMSVMNAETGEKLKEGPLAIDPLDREAISNLMYLHCASMACRVWWLTMEGHQSASPELRQRLIRIWELALTAKGIDAYKAAKSYAGHFYNGVHSDDFDEQDWNVPPCISNLMEA